MTQFKEGSRMVLLDKPVQGWVWFRMWTSSLILLCVASNPSRLMLWAVLIWYSHTARVVCFTAVFPMWWPPPPPGVVLSVYQQRSEGVKCFLLSAKSLRLGNSTLVPRVKNTFPVSKGGVYVSGGIAGCPLISGSVPVLLLLSMCRSVLEQDVEALYKCSPCSKAEITFFC